MHQFLLCNILFAFYFSNNFFLQIGGEQRESVNFCIKYIFCHIFFMDEFLSIYNYLNSKTISVR